MRSALRIVVSGVVQGVGFRAWTLREATRLGVEGWVRNLDDGSVEIWAEGEDHTLDALVRRCREGPRGAEVDALVEARASPRGIVGFTIRRT